MHRASVIIQPLEEPGELGAHVRVRDPFCRENSREPQLRHGLADALQRFELRSPQLEFGRRGYADSLNEMVDSLLILVAPLTAVDFKKRVIVAADYAVNGITKFGWDAVGILRLDTS